MSALLSPEEKARRIAAGEAVRKARAEKRKNFQAGEEKIKILKQPLVSVDIYHQGLNQRIAEASHYLHDVIFRRETLELKRIPEIVDLFSFPDEIDARVAFKMCYDNYCRLSGLCWHFQRGTAAVLGETAFNFWNKILYFPEVIVSGTLILNILDWGHIGLPLLTILKNHRQKIEDSSMSQVIVHTAERYLRDGGMTPVLTGEVKIWSEAQQDILKEIISLFKKDLRILEEMAEDSAE